MKPYKTYPSEKRSYKDRISGATVTQLTGYLGHSYHTYFTNSGWYDGNQRLLFTSDRENVTNLFSIHIGSGEISQLTCFEPGSRQKVHFTNDVNPKRPEVYYSAGREVRALNLETLETRPLYTPPEGFNASCGLVGADGQYIYGVLMEDLSGRIYADLTASYIGMREIFEAKPDCRVFRVNVDTGEAETLWQENCWIGHVNPSPTQPNLLTFCHEGNWEMVDHRIWLLDTEKGTPVKIRERAEKGEKIGHEYWYADGLRVGYQVHKPNDGSYFGVVNYDGTGMQEAKCVPLPSPDHVHSNDFHLIVSDSGKSIKLYRYNGSSFDNARVLAMHDGSFFFGSHHPHPRFTADGKQVLYNSNVSGYCNLYMVEVPEDVSALPQVQ
ncbi:oligogalacturonate lyase family protein [Lachnotalea sp. AF33-28]|uniref:oligogalacturonate lyase family protein n=1 Tax=Lachnotalea sp. AF33-28 TaxID=2292046 RepID=UPI001314DBAC|nr:oligogalacturonate lyase family protein [Lachnotalea sp. AF33-28]